MIRPLLLLLPALALLAGCASEPAGPDLEAMFAQDRTACVADAERLLPVTPGDPLYSGNSRATLVESMAQDCMRTRGWASGGAEGWRQGRVDLPA